MLGLERNLQRRDPKERRASLLVPGAVCLSRHWGNLKFPSVRQLSKLTTKDLEIVELTLLPENLG